MMTRRGLFKRLGGVIAAAVVGTKTVEHWPKWLAQVKRAPVPPILFSPEAVAALKRSSVDLFNPPQALIDSYYGIDPRTRDMQRMLNELRSLEAETVALRPLPALLTPIRYETIYESAVYPEIVESETMRSAIAEMAARIDQELFAYHVQALEDAQRDFAISSGAQWYTAPKVDQLWAEIPRGVRS